MTKMFLGIDPGSVNLGWAVVTDHGHLFASGFINPSSKTLVETVDFLEEQLPPSIQGCVTIERYVAYKGVMNPASEAILMLIGGIVYAFDKQEKEVYQLRAIDWKSNLCKYMFKKEGFKNPSKTFDKKYSMAMAEALCGAKPSTDHEADAICLAYYTQRNVGDKVI